MKYLALLTLGLIGCGSDPLIGPQFSGTVVFEFSGAVVQANQRIPASHGALTARLFWIGGRGQIEQQARLGSGLAEFSMTLFDPPPAEGPYFSELVDRGQLALGVVVLYADVNEDGRFSVDTDLLLGASAQHVVVYTSDPVVFPTAAEALLGRIEPGYHVFRHDRSSQCRFVNAADCPAEGGLIRLEDQSSVTLTLWEEPEDVIVPAPRLALPHAPESSIWTPQ